MSRRSGTSNYSGYYSSYGNRDAGRRLPNPLPYLAVALLAAAGLVYFHNFAFKSLSGKVTNAYTGAAMRGVLVRIHPGGQAGTAPPAAVSVTTTTTPDGGFHFPRVPEEPVVSVAEDGFAPQTITATGKTNLEIAMLPNTLSGRIVAPDGKGIPFARIFSGNATTVAGEDGSYLIKDLPADRRLVVKSPGYLANTVSFDKVNSLDVTLEPFTAKAIYINADSAATPGTLQQLIAMLDRTELNAVVL
ncbi:MAG TPA: carboxypeptidase regulatory-like domain-containing protein, partial [Chloroflexia bacterium]|nr:carboxypeptidase regulatory-like domain-containing protein [Chloroflexia bacterium]